MTAPAPTRILVNSAVQLTAADLAVRDDRTAPPAPGSHRSGAWFRVEAQVGSTAVHTIYVPGDEHREADGYRLRISAAAARQAVADLRRQYGPLPVAWNGREPRDDAPSVGVLPGGA